MLRAALNNLPNMVIRRAGVQTPISKLQILYYSGSGIIFKINYILSTDILHNKSW